MKFKRLTTAVGAIAISTLVLSGCAASADQDAETSEAITAEARSTAEEIIAPFVGQPGEFPVSEPLADQMPEGAKIAYVDNGNALVALMFQLMQPAAEELGVELYAVRAGTSASGVQGAFGTIVQQRPDAVINTSIDPALWPQQREQLLELGIPIVSLGTMEPESSGLVQPNSSAAFEQQGRLQAAWLVANNEEPFEVALYEHNELAYAPAVRTGFVDTLDELCPGCTARVVQIPLSEVGNSAPERIVSDLTANPNTSAIAFQSSAVATGLPAKLKVAGIGDLQIVGGNPLPTNLQYLADGQSTVEVAADLNTLAWTAIDTAARLIIDQEPSESVVGGNALVQQLLRPEDITFDPSRGFAGYPDVAERFAELWGH